MSRTININSKIIELPRTKAEFQEVFSGLPEEYERLYEVTLTDCANYHTPKDTEILNGFVDAFNKKYHSAETAERREEEYQREEKIAYAAFYTLNIILRTSLDNEKLNQLIEKNRDWCQKHGSFVHLNSLRYIQMGEIDDIEPTELIRQEYLFALDHHENAGYCHAFCDLYASFCEKDELLAEELTKEWGNRALKEINRAINLDETYAKYYCTKGRILALFGEYDDADAMIREAIRRENSNRADYALRVNSYQFSRSQIQSKRLVEETKQQIGAEKIRKEIDELKHAVVSNVEIIAFFSGIVSFIIGSLNLAKDQTATHASLLIITLMGCLTAVFSLFGMVLHLNDKSFQKKVSIILVIVGFFVAIISTALTYFI